MHDFKEGKTTLPYLYMYEALIEEDKKLLISYFGKELNEDEIAWIKYKMDTTKALEKAVFKAKKLGNEALRAIKNLDIEGLEGVVKQMIEREF
ncbi:MAG: polyprenyl synthetase family protein, partial [Campylobacteraceae bacterium]|nr:polyprenyl synthetase family protein [Campylobacteraceae bacterium]